MTHSDEVYNNPPDAPHRSGLLDLPVELLKKIISSLPIHSKASFIVNRFIRPICEERLYKIILLATCPRRSLRLLETFVARPDLALLVHYLSIDAGEVEEYQGSGRSLGGVNFDGAAALSLVKNLRHFSLWMWGSANWLREPGYASLRKVTFNLKLRGLMLPYIFDWTTWDNFRAGWNLAGRSKDMVHDIRSLLQAQPRLEHLSLIFCKLSDEVLSILKANLLSSDVPSLTSLEADQDVAIPFIAAAAELTSLKLSISGEWGDESFSELERSSIKSKFSLRHLAVEATSTDGWLLENFARVFALFPRMEELKLGIPAVSEDPDLQPPEYYFHAVGV
ncbi:hypothetical protein FRC01_007764 [Tulasnella sp. 417]|nr:hypothetical protein FRC01_007764 [Tulasnella sp. 417]